MQKFIIVATFKSSIKPLLFRDHWEAVDTIEEAERVYSKFLNDPNIYSASICKPIKSTDYC